MYCLWITSPPKATKGRIFIEKSTFISAPFDYQSKDNKKRPLQSQRPKGIHSSFACSFSTTEKVPFIAFFSAPTSNGLLGSKPMTKNYCLAILYNNRAGEREESWVVFVIFLPVFFGLLSAIGEENCRGWKLMARLWRGRERKRKGGDTMQQYKSKSKLSLAIECSEETVWLQRSLDVCVCVWKYLSQNKETCWFHGQKQYNPYDSLSFHPQWSCRSCVCVCVCLLVCRPLDVHTDAVWNGCLRRSRKHSGIFLYQASSASFS